jgi:lysophospholipase L1-like esterase
MKQKYKNSPQHTLSRRRFFTTSGMVLGSAGIGMLGVNSTGFAGEGWPPSPHSLLKDGETVLFQGDSITHAGRDKAKTSANEMASVGTGYAGLAAANLLVEHPRARYSIYNRGISGDKVFQLADRWQADCLDIKPNLLSILIGVNDFWHTLSGKYDGTVETYERDYRALLERTLKALPKVKLVLCEPYVLRCGTVNDTWFPQFDTYRAAARSVAKSFAAVFVPFQAMFDEAVNYAPPAYWAKDGIHPTSAGASLMASTWVRIVAGK